MDECGKGWWWRVMEMVGDCGREGRELGRRSKEDEEDED